MRCTYMCPVLWVIGRSHSEPLDDEDACVANVALAAVGVEAAGEPLLVWRRAREPRPEKELHPFSQGIGVTEELHLFRQSLGVTEELHLFRQGHRVTEELHQFREGDS